MLLREARERDDLFAETSLRSRHGYVTHLAAGEPAKARRELRDSISRWSSRGFYMQHYFALVAEADLALYEREPGTAGRVLEETLPALKRSRLLRVHHFRVEWLHLRARALVALAARAEEPERGTLLREAEAAARRLEHERVHWAVGLAALIRAGIGTVQGDSASIARALGFAVSLFTFADMSLYAAVGRRRLAAVLGGEKGRILSESADAWMRGQKIQEPENFAEMLAPGKWE
jgi:hypothetical protein